MRIGKKELGARAFGNLGVIIVLSLVTAWYLNDAWKASSDLLNLILVLPVSVLVLTLCSVEFVREFVRGETTEAGKDREPVRAVAPIILLFVAYVLSLGWLGFDVGTALFVGASLWIHGERRLGWVFGYAISLSVIVSLLFSQMLPYPMPMLLFPSAY